MTGNRGTRNSGADMHPNNLLTCTHGHPVVQPCLECMAETRRRRDNPPVVELRPWEPDEDGAYVVKMLADLYQHHTDMYRRRGISMTAPYIDLQDGDVMIIRACSEHEEGVVGVIVTATSNAFQRAACIKDVIIEPQFRRRGYASAAITECMSTMREQGVKHVGLNVSCWNTGAVKLYEAMGFAPTSQFMMKHLDGPAPKEFPPDEINSMSGRA